MDYFSDLTNTGSNVEAFLKNTQSSIRQLENQAKSLDGNKHENPPIHGGKLISDADLAAALSSLGELLIHKSVYTDEWASPLNKCHSKWLSNSCAVSYLKNPHQDEDPWRRIACQVRQDVANKL